MDNSLIDNEFLRKEREERLFNAEARELQLLLELKKHQTENAIFYFTRPNPKQAELLKAWQDKSNKVFTFTGGNRLGKTTIEVIICLSTLFGFFPWSKEEIFFPHKKPRKVRIVGQDWEKHIATVVVPALKKWWPKDRELFTRKNTLGIEAIWRDIETGSSLEIMSNNQESDLHEGWEGDLIAYDEPPKRNIRVANARGLVDRRGRELFSMTLLKEGWIDREIIKRLNDDGTPDTTIFNVHGEMFDNIGYGLTEEGAQQFIKTLTPEEYSARIKGVPSYMSGLVYSSFDRQKHLVKSSGVPLSWLIDIAIDVHPREKQAVLFIATTPRGSRYLVEEIWENGDGTFLGEEIIRSIKRNSYRVNNIIIDPFSKGDSNNENTVFDKISSVLAKYEYPLKVASKDKTAGILAVKEHLESPNGQASLFFYDSLKRTVFEIESYCWDEEKQKPKDKDDHMMENLYRLLLLDTQYSEPIEEEEEEKSVIRRTVTGY